IGGRRDHRVWPAVVVRQLRRAGRCAPIGSTAVGWVSDATSRPPLGLAAASPPSARSRLRGGAERGFGMAPGPSERESWPERGRGEGRGWPRGGSRTAGGRGSAALHHGDTIGGGWEGVEMTAWPSCYLGASPGGGTPAQRELHGAGRRRRSYGKPRRPKARG